MGLTLRFISVLAITIWVGRGFAGEPPSPELVKSCNEQMRSATKGSYDFSPLCSSMKQLSGCESETHRPIFHFDKPTELKGGRKILTLSLIHGDELPSLNVTRNWIARLMKIESRNAWRVIPIANPDGVAKVTRTNSRGVDINRNFPTEDWQKTALEVWKNKMKSDPRRYPGPDSASEKETRCLLKHIEEFNPDFIISIHTPLGVLDFDGPAKVKFPHFQPLPWISLGNYPGSLGRYMWRDKKVPVLTIELKGDKGVTKLEEFDRLQDISGTVAIQANSLIKRESDTKN